MNTLLLKQAEAILDDENTLGALANITAFISDQFPTVSWAGFYFLKDGKLFLGPFQGKVACSILSLDRGVCAFSFNKKETVNVRNVHEFPTHIACDSRTNSELVTPIIIGDKCIGVLDLDSIEFNNFSKDDEEFFNQLTRLIENRLASHECVIRHETII